MSNMYRVGLELYNSNIGRDYAQSARPGSAVPDPLLSLVADYIAEDAPSATVIGGVVSAQAGGGSAFSDAASSST